MTILAICFHRSFASPDISRHGNAVRMDSSGGGCGLGSKITCLLMQSDFVSLTHLVERINDCSRSRQSLVPQPSPPPPPAQDHGAGLFVSSMLLSEALVLSIMGTNAEERVFFYNAIPPCAGSSDVRARGIHVRVSSTDARLKDYRHMIREPNT